MTHVLKEILLSAYETIRAFVRFFWDVVCTICRKVFHTGKPKHK